ncbi:3-methyl-2-oxobutanoate hydroxymethyltransferase [Pullulanibacillus sp. KACC 23026]|uniref:3-methyl-2-oxobutanoate hydroxymethyltransferase n=1 Tax=Pullulanibacillus sp. KACC 23026 TaxID=3028315 RepID=UPI0023B1C4EB|nr:3-methyl-2-oxobutanoate hydroxymethyltransferase [Pullulanibacillus sp. KACC 23026]WEG11337.1 3-methyl-2-oxobutanoate hydroxymethyltransferase [Pullulanibacillus sp. KACC 23026]
MKSTAAFKKMKLDNDKIAMLTAYDYPAAKIAQDAGVDLILVGDSLGMVALGYDSTVPVTLEDMLLHSKAVRRGAPNTFVVTDMPFMTYHSSVSETLANASRLIQEGGTNAVKLEGAGIVLEMIDRLTMAGVPVVAHLGLTPQSVGVLGGFKVQGKDIEQAKQLLSDAKAAEQAGAFMLVLECVPQQLAAKVSEALNIPVIGIGAGHETDGQVLVYHDVIGYGGHRAPKFVKQYANITETIQQGIEAYIKDVKSVAFPGEEHAFNIKDETLQALYGGK